MTAVTPTVEVYFDLSETGGDFFTFDDPVKGEFDDTTYLFAGDIATDITAHTYAISIKRGRSRELDEIEAGTCAVGLRNYDGTFLPTTLDAAATYADNIRPGKRVRVSVDGISLFDGIIDDWEYQYDNDGRVDASFAASDALASLARKSFDEWTATAGQTAGPRLTAILNRPEVSFPANRSLDTGSSTLIADLITWGSNALNYAQLVVKSEAGRLFVDADGVLTFKERLALVNPTVAATFADDGTGIGFSGVAVDSSSTLLANRVGVDREGGTLQTSENAASIALYGVRQFSLSGLLIDSDTQSSDMADFLSNIYGEPQTRIGALTVYLDALSGAERASVLGLDLADVVSVVWTPTGASGAMTQNSVVEGVSHETTFDGLHVVTLSLSPVQQSEALIFDDAVFGVFDSGVFAY
jgi:hypothetical protein